MDEERDQAIAELRRLVATLDQAGAALEAARIEPVTDARRGPGYTLRTADALVDVFNALRAHIAYVCSVLEKLRSTHPQAHDRQLRHALDGAKAALVTLHDELAGVRRWLIANRSSAARMGAARQLAVQIDQACAALDRMEQRAITANDMKFASAQAAALDRISLPADVEHAIEAFARAIERHWRDRDAPAAQLEQPPKGAPDTQAQRDEQTAEEIIGKYYMRRGRNTKLTLRQHIKDSETTLSEGYIRKRKVAYDKRHRRGKVG